MNDAPDPDTVPPEPPPDNQENAKLRRENAAWRRKFREAESALQAQAEQIAAYERADLERLAAEKLANPADLALVVDVDQLREDDGSLSSEKVGAAVDRVLAERPHWAKSQPESEPEPDNGRTYPDFHGGARTPPAPPPPSFGDLLKRS
jgi:hypothetical protein